MTRYLLIAFFSLCALAPSAAQAELTIEVVGGAAQQIPIAIVPFADAQSPDALTPVIGADLRRSGLFRTLETRGVANQPHDLAEVKYPDWTALQAQALVIGKVEPLANGKLKVSFRLLDVLKQTSLAGLEYEITPAQARGTAHKIADVIYEKLTGERGVFATRIAYITKIRGSFALQVADSDGANAQTVLTSKEPIISPAWSPDGSRLAYVSFEKKKPIVYVQSLVSGQRAVLAGFKGNNSAPAWSPDGSKLAIVLTYAANSQVFTINADGSGLRQVTLSRAIDTEPVWSPDGKWIYFTSDRGGSPQIYKTPVTGGEVTRVTYEGGYNVSPALSPDGKLLTYVRRENGKFRLAQQDLATGQVQLLSDTGEDESPSYAPNGRQILYATSIGGREVLAVVSSDGRTKQRLSEAGSAVREPAWGSWMN
ncbi:MAG: Tol-Pal system beta propeller repeat protein TolB [Methylobacillus sp.]|jgi:TolB protein|nr:Tol-Pal system beta propeller repeat protein TolB [Methylobacillus sp.]